MTEKVAKDLFGREVGVGDLVVYGHSGRYAGTRIARVYQVDDVNTIRVYIVESTHDYEYVTVNERIVSRRIAGSRRWVKGHHAKPNGFVLITEDVGIPSLEELRASGS